MKKIEYADLVSLGASKRALDFYNGTQPCVIWKDNNGMIHMNVFDSINTYNLMSELINDLDSYAESMEYMEGDC